MSNASTTFSSNPIKWKIIIGGLLLSSLPFLFAGMTIFIFAKGQPDITNIILTNIDFPSFVLSTFLRYISLMFEVASIIILFNLKLFVSTIGLPNLKIALFIHGFVLFVFASGIELLVYVPIFLILLFIITLMIKRSHLQSSSTQIRFIEAFRNMYLYDIFHLKYEIKLLLFLLFLPCFFG